MSNSIPEGVLREIENRLYNQGKSLRTTAPASNFSDGDFPSTSWNNDPTKLVMQNNVTPEILRQNHLCRTIVVQGSNGNPAIVCARQTHDTRNGKSSKHSFCSYHGLCNASVGTRIVTLEDNTQLTVQMRCNNFRIRHKKKPDADFGGYSDPDFSMFCEIHNQLGTQEACGKLNKAYKSACHDNTTLSNLDIHERCEFQNACYTARYKFKNKCTPFTEDNGHYLARSQVLKDLWKNCQPIDSKYVLFQRDQTVTLRQPWIIDQVNDMINGLSNQ